MKNWLPEQVNLNTEQWDQSLVSFYPEASQWMSDPLSYLEQLTVNCNYLEASKLIDWDKYLPEGANIMDIACGGWLTAYLSRFKQVSSIISTDSSSNYLQNYLPKVVEAMDGEMDKISTVQALFTPIIADDDSIDLIVISSAVHHADSIQGVFSEFNRVLKPDGHLIILNETPDIDIKYVYNISKSFLKSLRNVLTKKYKTYVQKVSEGGFLYDPFLGDIDYPLWYWEKAIQEASFDLVELMDTKLPTVKGTKGRTLKHFVCQKIS